MSITETDDSPEGPSRSQQRRDAIAVFKLAEELVALGDAALARLPLPAEIIAEVRRTRAVTQQIARKRETQFLAKQMRRLDGDVLDPVRSILDNDRGASRRQAADLHQIELWRDRLLAEGDDALGEWIAQHPHADRQQLRALIRQAKIEAERAKPPRAARELFRLLRETVPAA